MRWLRRSLPNLLPAALTLSIGLIVADSVLRAGWASEVPALRVVAVLAGLAAIGLARSRVPGWAALLLGLLGGVVVVSGAALALPSLAEHSLPIDRVVALGERLETWVADALQNDISTDSLPFGVVVAAAVWLATWIGAYAYQRWREPWLLVVLPGVVLAVNVSYLGRSFDWHFALYGIVAGLLIAEGHRQRVLARASSGSLPPRVQSISLAMVVLVSVGGVAGAHALPRLDREAEWAGTVGLVTTSVADLREDVSRLFAGASPPSAPGGLPLGPVLPLADIGGGIDRLVARVQLIGAEGPTYLRAVAYNRYDGRGWLADETEPGTVPGGRGDGELELRVEVMAPTRTLLLPGDPIAIDLEATAILARGEPLVVALDAPLPAGLPADLRSSLEAVQALAQTSQGLRTDANALVPPRFTVEIVEVAPNAVPLLRVRDAAADADVVQITASRTLQAGDRYVVRATAVQAVEGSLDQRTAYPLRVTQRYLDLPPEWAADPLVRQLMSEVAIEDLSPYALARAIESWLCCSRLPDGRLRYPDEPRTPAPPPGADAVRWFLVERVDLSGRPLGGSATLHASAMTTMLRAAGVPSRLAVGFLIREVDDRVHSLWAHDTFAWVEVYLPAQGWSPFNPTPGPDLPLYDLDAAGLGGGASLQVAKLLREFEAPAQAMPRPARRTLQRTSRSPLNEGGFDWQLPLIIAAAFVGLVATPTALWRLSLRGRGEAERTWASVQRWARLSGVQGRTSMTPAEFAALVGERAGAATAVALLADDYAASRFGRGARLGPEERREAHAAARRALLRLCRLRVTGVRQGGRVPNFGLARRGRWARGHRR